MRNLLTAVIFSTVFASSAWASIGACPGISSTPTESLDTINANTPTGCQIVDKQFSNFTSTPVGQTATIEMLNTSSGGVVGPNSVTGLITNFAAPGLWKLSPTSTTTSVFNYQGTIDQVDSPPASGSWEVSRISLGLNLTLVGSEMRNGDSITVRMNFCPAATTVAGCSNLQFIQVVVKKVGSVTTTFTNSAGNSNSFLDVSGLGDTSIFAVQDSLTFVGNGTTSTQPINFITNGFDELTTTPEPSTFVLFGMALAGVGALRYRRRGIA